MPELNLKQELEKLENLLEKYVKVMKDNVDHYDEELKSEEVNQEQKVDFQKRKQELEAKIEKVKKTYLAQLYLDKEKLSISEKEKESSKGKVAGTFGGIGAGAAGGAAAGAGAMVLLSPYTFGLSLTFIPAAATIGAITGGLGGGATGLAVGSIVDRFSDSERAEQREEIKGFLEDYKSMIEDPNEIKEIEVYIENNYHNDNVEKLEVHIESK